MQPCEDWSKYQFEICPCCGKPQRPQLGAKIHREGDIVLDPMAGSGTLLRACSLGRNVILVELEEKFVAICRKNWERIQRIGPEMGYSMGTATILQGDARQLEGLLCDKIITSPPYAETIGGGSDREVQIARGRNPDSPGASPQAIDNPENISRLPYGKVDKIVTSPPYAEMITRKPSDKDIDNEAMRIGGKLFNYNPDNKDNISNLPYGEIDKIITSPPYEGGMDGGSRHTKGGIPQGVLKMKRLGSYDTPSKQNIGNLYGNTYLEAMLRVYQSCFAVLKPQGLMVLVTKNFIRKTEVRLDMDTIRLMEAAGFRFVERHYRRLLQESFWRVIYQQKYPEADQISFEDVLVFEKPFVATE
jgi:DNA modification methylase